MVLGLLAVAVPVHAFLLVHTLHVGYLNVDFHVRFHLFLPLEFLRQHVLHGLIFGLRVRVFMVHDSLPASLRLLYFPLVLHVTKVGGHFARNVVVLVEVQVVSLLHVGGLREAIRAGCLLQGRVEAREGVALGHRLVRRL